MKPFMLAGAAIVAALVVGGCAAPYSEAPQATNFPASQQEKLQAAAHWEVVSKDLAREIMAALPTPLIGNLHVAVPGESSPFTEVMKEELITQLVRGGYPVARGPDAALSVEIDTQVLKFSEDRGQGRWIGVPTALAAGAWAVRTLSTEASGTTTAAATATAGLIGVDLYRWFKAQSASGPTPKTEIVVSVSVADETRYLARATHVYYVADSDRALYDAASTKIYYVVGAR